MSVSKASVALLVMALPISAVAQTTGPADSPALRGKHGIEVSLGFLSGISSASQVSAGGVETRGEFSGVIGSIGYNYWFADQWALNLSLGVASAEASTSVSGAGVTVESATVLPLLLGVKYKPIELAVGDALRPYVYASIGPYFGFASDVRTGATTGTESYSETAFGSRAGVGTDLSLGTRFMLGFAVGYRFVTDFERRIGSDKNHSSPEFALSFGVLLGKGQE